MANKKAKARGLSDRVQFQLKDANQWQPEPESVDIVWTMESSEHFRNKKEFFKRCASVLKPGGVLAVCAWLRRDGPTNVGRRTKARGDNRSGDADRKFGWSQRLPKVDG